MKNQNLSNKVKSAFAALTMPLAPVAPLVLTTAPAALLVSCAGQQPIAGVQTGTFRVVDGKRTFIPDSEVAAARGEAGSFTKSSEVTVAIRTEVCKDGKCGSSKKEVLASNTVNQQSGSQTLAHVGQFAGGVGLAATGTAGLTGKLAPKITAQGGKGGQGGQGGSVGDIKVEATAGAEATINNNGGTTTGGCNGINGCN